MTLDIFDEREYRKRYLEERRAEEPNLLYPDADEIYKRYFELRENSVPKSKIEEKIKELSEGIKRDLENQAKVKDESWKKAIEWSRVQKSETKKVLQELLESEENK